MAEGLHQSRSLLRSALAVTRDGLLMVDEKRRVVGYNQRFVELWGVPQGILELGRDEEVQKYIKIQLGDPEGYAERVEAIYAGVDREVLDTLHLKDGRVFESYTCPSMEGEEVVGRAWSFSDTTQTRQAQDALWHSEFRYRTLFEGSRHAVYITTRDGAFISANRAARELFGFEEEEMAELNARDFYLVPEEREAYQREIERNGFVQDYEIQLRKKDGTLMHCLITGTVRKDPLGRIVEYEGIIDDITARKEAEESLKTSERRFRSLIENALDTITLIDADGRILYESPAVERVLGYPPASRQGRDFFKYLHPDDRLGIREEIMGLVGSHRRTARLELRHRHVDSSWKTLEVVGQNLLEDPAIGGVVINARDVTDRKAAEDRILFDALHDRLTGLPNRVLFMDRLSQLLRRLTRDENDGFAVLFLDLDDFKLVNDSLGHMIGDQLLISLTRRLTSCVRPGDTVARLGGDEFAFLLVDNPSIRDAETVAGRVHETLAVPFLLGGHEVYATASIGITHGTASYRRGEEVLRDADLAMYRAKSKGRGKLAVFDGAMHTEAVALLRLETDLRRALEREEFQPYYQPILDMGSGALKGFEVLVRWVHPEDGLILPGDFLATAENSHLLAPIGWLMLEKACRQLAEWAEEVGVRNLPHLNVNVSVHQLFQGDMEERVGEILKSARTPDGHLTLELTESSIMESPEAALRTLQEIKRQGIGIAIDDFGTGYSSLSYLHRFPADCMKIDRSFVQPLGGGREEGIVRGIIGLARDLRMTTIAEGVENPTQLRMLRELGCGFAQGFLFSQPVPEEKATDILKNPLRWAGLGPFSEG